MMRRILMAILLGIGLVGIAYAQEATGEVAEQVKREILEMEEQKMRAFTSTTSGKNYAGDWLERVGADDMAWSMPDGSFITKAEMVAQFRTGKKVYSITPTDRHIRVYGNGGNGTTAVVTYQQMADSTGLGPGGKGPHFMNKLRATDVFVKMDGQWRWVVHSRVVAGIKDMKTFLKEAAAKP